MWTTSKRYDDEESYSIDLTNDLDPGETVSSATWGSSGPTISGTAIAGNVISFDLTGSGRATLNATLSSGRVLEKRLRWVATDETPDDYE